MLSDIKSQEDYNIMSDPMLESEHGAILVVGLVRNLEKVLKNNVISIAKSLSSFEIVHWFLVESDSKDKTSDTLLDLQNEIPNFHFIQAGNLEKIYANRTERLAFARNLYLSELELNTKLVNVKFVLVADFDDTNLLLNQAAINSCFERSDWAVCAANQEGPYYDVWALRHPLWSPNDCWEQHKFFKTYYRNPEMLLFLTLQSRMIRIPKNSEWLEVESAFGGLALYKREAITNLRYSGLDSEGNVICEHVEFHKKLRDAGFKIYINPKLINIDYVDHSIHTLKHKKILRMAKYPFKFLHRLLRQ